MKRLTLLLALILALAICPAAGRADETAGKTPEATGETGQATAPEGTEKATGETGQEGEAVDAPPAFSLSNQEGDAPARLRLKAALRLLKSYQITTKAIQLCAAAPGAEDALKNFHRRNGNTLAPPVISTIRDHGGLTPEIKAVMDAEVTADTEALLKSTNCKALIDLVTKSARDLYKAPELAEDYKLVRSKP